MKKFLIIRLSSLGDIILTFPVLRNIKLNYPNSKILYLTKKQFKDLLEINKDVDEIIVFDGLFKTIKKLRKENFDFIFDLHSNIRSFFIKKLLKSEKKITYKKDSLLRYVLILFKYISPKLERHVIEKYLEVLKMSGLNIYTKEITIESFNKTNKKNFLDLNYKKIIIFQTAFIGDLLLTLPLIKKIKDKYPNSFIALVVRKENLKVAQTIEEINKVFIDDKSSNKIKSFINLIKNIKKEYFDISIMPHRSFRTALISYFSHIPQRIGFDIFPASLLYNIKIPFKWNMHDLERNMMLIKDLVFETDIDFPNFSLNINEETNFSKPIIIINPSSIWTTKRWPDFKFAKLIKMINDRYFIKPILIGSEREKKQISSIEKFTSSNSFINLCGKTDLKELIYLIKNSDLLISNDSGPMHIAVACKTPVIAIFGPTTKELGFFPYSKNSIVIEEELNCRPCRLHGSDKCPHKHFLCMKLIRVEKVFKYVEKFLKYKL
ncbi:MAG: lipopolysaccharide heptosyltransferase II [Elusimicrobiales bacterium]|nr:lipopolysaccharide heptosyltransferase II [Elusimicrobiales bacterium]